MRVYLLLLHLKIHTFHVAFIVISSLPLGTADFRARACVYLSAFVIFPAGEFFHRLSRPRENIPDTHIHRQTGESTGYIVGFGKTSWQSCRARVSFSHTRASFSAVPLARIERALFVFEQRAQTHPDANAIKQVGAIARGGSGPTSLTGLVGEEVERRSWESGSQQRT